MRAYVIRRLLLVIPTLLLVTFAVFMTVRCIPGSTVDLMVAEMMSSGGSGNTQEMEATLRHELGLDQPLALQYFRWLGVAKQENGRYSGILEGDLGHSLWQ